MKAMLDDNQLRAILDTGGEAIFDFAAWTWQPPWARHKSIANPEPITWIDAEGQPLPHGAALWKLANQFHAAGWIVSDITPNGVVTTLDGHEVGRMDIVAVVGYGFTYLRLYDDLHLVTPIIWDGKVTRFRRLREGFSRNARIQHSERGAFYVYRPGRQMRLYYTEHMTHATRRRFCRLLDSFNCFTHPHPFSPGEELDTYDFMPEPQKAQTKGFWPEGWAKDVNNKLRNMSADLLTMQLQQQGYTIVAISSMENSLYSEAHTLRIWRGLEAVSTDDVSFALNDAFAKACFTDEGDGGVLFHLDKVFERTAPKEEVTDESA